MLILRRKVGESVMVGDAVELTVLEVGHQRVRLGFAAPASVAVLRKEVWLTQQQNFAAAQAPKWESVSALAQALHTLTFSSKPPHLDR